MTAVVRALPERVRELIAEGYTHIDVRTEVEFAEGHPPGSWNVPMTLETASGTQQNQDFLRVVGAHFDHSAKLILGYATGVRSRHAVQLLIEAGYTDIVDSVAGFCGAREPFGRKTPGWLDSGLPTETGLPLGRSFASLRARAGSGEIQGA
jgi:rhodanese-related sulfurtransferase